MGHGTVIVLGAGATRGAEWQGPHENGRPLPARHAGAPLPALDRDFFDRLQEVSDNETEHAELIRQVTADARWIAKGEIYPSLEGAFTFIEASRSLEADVGFRINGEMPSAVRERLLRAVALQLGSALCKPNAGEGNDAFYRCRHHLWLANQRTNNINGAGLTANDTIISFNYDCLMDHALARGSSAWNPRIGYLLDGPANWERWAPGEGHEVPPESLKLLKMHGSLNWLDKEDRASGITLSEHNYRDVRRPLIIPPEWNKQIGEKPFDRIWKVALEAVSQAQSIVFIGYSMPLTDLRAQVMFRAARQSANGNLEKLVVVNPDEHATRRIVQVIDDGTGGTPVIRLDSWRQFVDMNVGAWHR